MDVSFKNSLRVSILIFLWNILNICVHMIFGALRSYLFWWDVSTMWSARQQFSGPKLFYYSSGLWIINVVCVQVAIIGVKHVLGTRLLQKCLRHSPPGVVCTQVWNLKELTEGHHKSAWSMWLNLTQRGKSYRVRTHWGLTGACIAASTTLAVGVAANAFKYASPFMIVW